MQVKQFKTATQACDRCIDSTSNYHRQIYLSTWISGAAWKRIKPKKRSIVRGNGSWQKRSGLVPRGTAARSSHAATLVNLSVQAMVFDSGMQKGSSGFHPTLQASCDPMVWQRIQVLWGPVIRRQRDFSFFKRLDKPQGRPNLDSQKLHTYTHNILTLVWLCSYAYVYVLYIYIHLCHIYMYI